MCACLLARFDCCRRFALFAVGFALALEEYRVKAHVFRCRSNTCGFTLVSKRQRVFRSARLLDSLREPPEDSHVHVNFQPVCEQFVALSLGSAVVCGESKMHTRHSTSSGRKT